MYGPFHLRYRLWVAFFAICFAFPDVPIDAQEKAPKSRLTRKKMQERANRAAEGQIQTPPNPVPSAATPQQSANKPTASNPRQLPADDKIEVVQLTPTAVYVPAFDQEKNGAGMRGPSNYAVDMYHSTATTFSRTLALRAMPKGKVTLTYLTPCVRSLGEISFDGCIVAFGTNGVSDASLEVDVVSCMPNNNRYLLCTFSGTANQQDVQIQPTVNVFATQPFSVRMPSTATLAAAQKISQVVQDHTVYDAKVNILEVSDRGDCGVFAVNACNLSGGEMQVVIGWDYESKSSFGLHAWAQTTNGNIICDAAMKHVGAQLTRHFPATVGIEFKFAEGSTAQKLTANIPYGIRNGTINIVTGAQLIEAIPEANVLLNTISTQPSQNDEHWTYLRANLPKEWHESIQKSRLHSKAFVKDRMLINSGRPN